MRAIATEIMCLACVFKVSAINSTAEELGRALESIHLAKVRSAESSCYAIVAQHKSAGQTINGILSLFAKSVSWKFFACDDNMNRYLYRHQNRCCLDPSGHETNQALPPPRIIVQGYSHTMEKFSFFKLDNCMWSTMFRNPMSRLISAKFYCTEQSNDALCGSRNSSFFHESSNVEFAKYWGNFQFTNLLLHPRLAPFLSIGPSAKRIGKIHPAPKGMEMKGWQIFRQELDGGDNPRTQAGAQNLELVRYFLPLLFDEIGVLELYSQSWALFDCGMPLGGTTWEKQASKNSVPHYQKNKADERLAIADALNTNDPLVRDEISGDIRIYEDAVAIVKSRFQELQLGSRACFRNGET